MLSHAPAKFFGFLLFFSLLASVTLAQTFSDPKFTSELVLTLPAYQPVGLTFAPDGRMFVWQESGKVRIYKQGVLLPTPFVDISSHVNWVGDRGLLGLALDPNFATNGYVYLYYTYEPNGNQNDVGRKTGRVTRVKADPNNPDVALANSETVILGSISTTPCGENTDCLGHDSDSHDGGTLQFGLDGKLYVSTGDGASYSFEDPLALRAQSLNSLNGKILRLNPDGTAPSDNPFYDGNPNSVRSKVYSYGLRNPYRFAIHPTTGELLIGDVGWAAYEEVNRGRGANFGWPCFEGDSPQASYQGKFPSTCGPIPASSITKPIYFYGHSEGQAVIGGTVYNGTQFPAVYRGNFFFADYPSKWIKRLVFDANGNVSSVQPFATNIGGLVSLEQGPDGALYYILLESGQVRRIRYASTPTAVASANPTTGASPLAVSFSSAGSSDPNGLSLTYLWEFGDGTTSTQANPVHTYTSSSFTTFTAKLTVTNSQNASASTTVVISVGNRPPVATITAPANGTTARPGETINYTGTATDPDETLSASAMSWQLLLHHDDHVHPYQAVTGTGGSFVVEDHGAGTFYYEIVLTVTDSRGATNTKSVNVSIDSGGSSGNGLKGEYYDNVDFTALKLTRTDPTVNFNWGTSAPDPLINAETFSVRWTGFVQPQFSEAYTFYVRYDDGVRLLVNGQLLVDDWTDNSPREKSGTLNLLAGQKYSIKLEFYENLIDAVMQLSWSSASQPKQIIPQNRLFVGTASNNPPTVSLTAPANGSSFTAPATITINATAADSDGTITKVEFYNGTTLLGTDTTAPFSFSWNNVPAGNYALTARATDNGGLIGTSAPVNINVNGTGTTITYLSDLNWVSAVSSWGPVEKDRSNGEQGATDGNPITLNGVTYAKGLGMHAAADVRFNLNGAYNTFLSDVGIDDEVEDLGSVVFQVWVDGVLLYDSGTMSGATATKQAVVDVTGKNELRLVVLAGDVDYYDHADWANARLLSNGAQNNPPTVSLSTPANGASFPAPANITITANANDNDGSISKVEFYQGTTLLGTATSNPYNFTWNNVGAGNYALTAKAFDNQGAATTSSAVNITVSNNAAPSVSISSPSNNAVFTAPANITVNANASDTDGTISKVEFYAGTTLLGTDTSAPYSFNWSNVAAGSYALTVKATDDRGATTTSGVVNITVNSASGGLPAPWQNQDVGSVSATGAASFSSSTFTLKGSGADIWDYNDNFHFVWQPLTGNGEIVARVVSVQNTNAWAKAGVMIRNSLATNAPYAAMLVTPSRGAGYQWRYFANGNSGSQVNSSIRAPYWVRLVRQGNNLSGYISTDGITWMLVRTEAIPDLQNTVYVGLAVTSHNNGTLCTATFDNVKVQ